MKKLKLKVLICTIVCIVGLLAGSFTTVFAYNIFALNGFDPVPCFVYYSNDFDYNVSNAITQAINTWNGAGRGNLVYAASTVHYTTTYPYSNNANEITWGSRGTGTYIGQCYYTSWSFWSQEIYEADIDLNTSYPLSPTGASGYYDIQSTMTHELGHLLGLDHSDDTTATMYSGASPGDTSRRTLEPDDINGLQEIY